ncbi:MAG: CPBP family intramembrane metalloprotease [Gammaproteobacteria bacterium]|nr:CPBP family intramembrane metalloprotease [Gammaproteobacteria bacterium]NIM74951.1 CPBP family intramembrane metalloprotease [Gammaproteobacteria bacterium]NIN39740.1 CPBP family intramembrane metalloprotease [Gammaproteobacteria bacterium]NIO26868.1 CPBP family intramembrane metalloprotease [Gammaproteobacteria bacterium]NIO67424.1 CPBP family intramembrane metalloprotease [Gammaproteobacteria bacterium]
MVLAPFLIYALATLVLTALTAYPVFLGLEALGLRDMPFDQMVMRLLKLYALLGLWPLLSGFGINTRSAWGYGPGRTGRSFSRGLVLGAVIGIASMALVVLVLLALEIRVVRPGIELTPPLVTAVVLQSAFAGLMVGFIEETWFRGALQTSITHVSNSAFAIVFISMVYGAMHFISADINVPAEEVGWLSGTAVLFTSLHGFRDPAFFDSLFALVAGGLLLGLVRYRTGRIAECIGIHAGWVMVVKMLRQTTYPNLEASGSFMIGDYDGVIGILAGLWFSSLAVTYYVCYGRRMRAG